MMIRITSFLGGAFRQHGFEMSPLLALENDPPTQRHGPRTVFSGEVIGAGSVALRGEVREAE